MNIYGISPEYLGPIADESTSYDISIALHGSFEEGYKNLIWINSSQLCALLIVAEKLPTGNELLYLHKLVEAFNMISEHSEFKKRLIFGLKDDTGLAELVRSLNTSNLEVFGDRFDIMTDLYIRRELFGTAISSYKFPYKDSVLASPQFRSRPLKALGYNPVFHPTSMRALQSVKLRTTFEETIIEDKSLELLRNDNSFYYNLRVFAIKRLFDGTLTSDKVLDTLLDTTSDKELKFSYTMFYEYAKSNVLEVDL